MGRTTPRLLMPGLLVFIVLVAAPLSSVAGTPAVASSSEGLTGLWLTQDGDGHVRIEPCDDGLCGSIVWMKDPLDESGAARLDVENPDPGLRNRPVQGMTVLHIPDEPDAKGILRGGRIYDPKTGRTYRCTIRPDGADTLKMRGYLGISLIGRTTRWTRQPEGINTTQLPIVSGQ